MNLLGSNYRKQKERYLQQRKEAVETVKSRKKKWDEVQAEIKQLTNQGGATKETTTEAAMEPEMEADALMPWDEAVEIREDTSLEEQDLQMEPTARAARCNIGLHEALQREEDGNSTRENEEAGGLDEYEPSAPFQWLAAQDNKLWFTLMAWCVGLASFRFRHGGRYGTLLRLDCWHYLGILFVIKDVINLQLHGLPALGEAGASSFGAAWNNLFDFVLVMGVSSGFFLDYIMGLNNFFVDFLTGFIVAVQAPCQLFLTLRRPRFCVVKNRRIDSRGRLRGPLVSLAGCVVLGLCVGAEGQHVLQSIHGSPTSYFPEFFDKSSAGDPEQPPEVPECFTEETLTEEDLASFDPQVILMNTYSLMGSDGAIHLSSNSTDRSRPQNMIMFGHFDRPEGRRDAVLEDLREDTIRAAVRATWPEFPGVLELYHVEPQPERLASEGWVTLVYGQQRGLHLPGILVLKEIVTFRHTWACQTFLQTTHQRSRPH